MKNRPNSIWNRLKNWLADTGKQLAIAIFIVMVGGIVIVIGIEREMIAGGDR